MKFSNDFPSLVQIVEAISRSYLKSDNGFHTKIFPDKVPAINLSQQDRKANFSDGL